MFTSPAEGEVILYEAYFRRMRPTGITNLCRQPTLKKIAQSTLKIPTGSHTCNGQVLKDMMLDIADMDHQATLEGMQGAEGGEEISEIMGKVYKVRPLGLPAVNMRHIVKIRINSFVLKV